MNVKYALIQGNKIIKFKSVDPADIVILPKLLAHGYRIVIEETSPEYDNVTQMLEDRYDIEPTQVVRRWTVTERLFTEAKKMKEEQIKQQVLGRIEAVFDDVEEVKKVTDALSAKNITKIDIEVAETNEDLRSIELVLEAK